VFSEKSLIADAALTLNISDTKYYGQSNFGTKICPDFLLMS